MADSTQQSQQIMAAAKRSLADQRAGGRRVEASRPIGEGSARLRRTHLMKKIRNLLIAVFVIWVGAGIAGAILSGIGFWGVMALLVATAVATAFFSTYPRMRAPQRAELTRTTDAARLVARTELWLESQRPALPPPAVTLVDNLGVQLDALGRQLEHVDPAHPAAAETRKLVGEILPETVDAYRRIPAHLRTEERAGATPDAQLVDSLGKISREIDLVTRQLAEGSLDELAIKNRYLDYRYGDAEALPPPEKN